MRLKLTTVFWALFCGVCLAQTIYKVDLGGHDLVVLTAKTPQGGIGEIDWADGQTRFSPRQSYPFYLAKSSQPRTYLFDLKAYTDTDKVKFLLLFLPPSSEIISLTTVKASFSQKLLAAWQEFWGPRGRQPSGTDFLVIQPALLFGRSIFICLYWLIGAAVLIGLAAKKPRDAIIFILALWLALEAGSWLNNWLSFRGDLRFLGKSLDEKRTMQNYRDFYPFMKFAEAKIPPTASWLLITDPKYRFSSERATYYLYPRPFREKAEYILLFDKLPNRQVLKSYRVFAKFREGAYILKVKSQKSKVKTNVF